MIVKFHARGKGGGSGPVDYLLGRERNREGATVLQGNPEEVRELIDATPFAKKYTSGVLSFAEKELPPGGRERGRLRKRKKSYAKHRKETRDGQARYGRGSCLPIAQLPLTRNSVSVPAAINTAASPKPTTGETAVHTTPTEALEMNLAAPLTVPSAP